MKGREERMVGEGVGTQVLKSGSGILMRKKAGHRNGWWLIYFSSEPAKERLCQGLNSLNLCFYGLEEVGEAMCRMLGLKPSEMAILFLGAKPEGPNLLSLDGGVQLYSIRGDWQLRRSPG